MPAPSLVTAADVARRKDCSGMAVRNAVKRGELNAVKLGPVWAISDDDALAAWTVNETGGRAHRDGPRRKVGPRRSASAEV